MVIFPNVALISGGIIADTIGWRGSMFTLSVFGFFFLCTPEVYTRNKTIEF